MNINIYCKGEENLTAQHRNLQQHCRKVATFHIAVQCCKDIAKSFFFAILLQQYCSNVLKMM